MVNPLCSPLISSTPSFSSIGELSCCCFILLHFNFFIENLNPRLGWQRLSEMNVIFDDMIELCQISSSQEEILRQCSLVERNDGAPLSSDGILVASTGIAMASLPETAEDTAKDKGSQEVFHTPPEQQSSQSASGGHGQIHKAVETDDEIQGFFDFSECAEAAECVDLRDNSELGFPQGKLNQRTERTLVAECLDGNDGARVIEISRSEVDNFRISKRVMPSNDSSGESPPKKVNNSKQNAGFESSQACFGFEQHLENHERNIVSDSKCLCNFGAIPQPEQNFQIGKEIRLGVGDKKNHSVGISVEKNSGSSENLGGSDAQLEIEKGVTPCVENMGSEEENYEAEDLLRTGEGNKQANEVAETFEREKGGDEQPESSVLPSSAGALSKNIAKIRKENQNGNNFVFDILKALTKESPMDDSLDNVSFMDLSTSCGFNFPRPYWWKENDSEKN